MKRRLFDVDIETFPQPDVELDHRQDSMLVSHSGTIWRLTLAQVFLEFGFVGITRTAATPTTTEFPNADEWGFHVDTSTTPDTVYLVFNLDGAIKKVALS